MKYRSKFFVLGNFSLCIKKPTLFFICCFYFSAVAIAQQIKKSNQSLSFLVSVHADDNFPEVLGKSADLMYEHRIWGKLHLKGDLFISNSQIMRGPRDVAYIAIFGGNVDMYANYFVGQTRSATIFKTESFILNRTVFQLGISYRFGKKNQFIPEVGLSTGSGYKASLNIEEIATQGDTIRYVRSSSNFLRTRISGYYVGFSYAFHMKNNFYIQPTMRFYDIQNRSAVSARGGLNGLSGASLGVTVRKDFFPRVRKRLSSNDKCNF